VIIIKGAICEACGLDYHVYELNKTGHYYCDKHIQQMRLHGKIRERTVFDKNLLVLYDDYGEVILEDRKLNERARSKFSLDKIDIIKKHKWRLNTCNYAVTNIKGKPVGMHRILLDAPHNKVIDHFNRDTLDNRTENIRICTQHENIKYKDMQCNNTTGVTGVWWDNEREKWGSEIKGNGKKVFKRFDTFEDAVYFRLINEKKFYGEFAPQQKLFKQYGII
jgi:hypothetical protein